MQQLFQRPRLILESKPLQSGFQRGQRNSFGAEINVFMKTSLNTKYSTHEKSCIAMYFAFYTERPCLLCKEKKNYAQNSFPLNEKEGNTMCNISLEENSKNFALEKSCLIVYTAVQIWERPELEAARRLLSREHSLSL